MIAKYFEIFKISLLNRFFYIWDTLFMSLFIVLIVFIFIRLWQAIYETNPIVAGFTITLMLWYFLMSESIVTSRRRIVQDVIRDVKTGAIANQINKPYNYIYYRLSHDLGSSVVGFSLTFILGGILVFYSIGLFNFNLLNTIPVLIVVFMAILIDSLMLNSIGLLAFWFEDSNSFRFIYQKLVFLIGGMIFPLDIFPAWLSETSKLLPFSYIAYHPAKLFVQFSWGYFFEVIFIQIFYVLLMLVVIFIIYNLGLKRVSVNGG